MMNQRITLQRRAPDVDTFGQPVDDWRDIAGVWADVRFPFDPMHPAAGAAVPLAGCLVRIRFRPDIGSAMRVFYKDRAYTVAAALPDERDSRFMLLVCESLR